MRNLVRQILHIIIWIFFAITLSYCKNTHVEKLLIVKYTDSTFQVVVDSLYIIGEFGTQDTIFCNEEFSLNNGCFKFYNSQKNSYTIGCYNDGKEIGKWVSYQYFLTGNWTINQEINYNQEGQLHGKYINYYTGNSTPIPMIIENFVDGMKFGIQEGFFDNGDLHMQYELDDNEQFINKFIVYNPNGDTLYFANLGEIGTGYIKFYNHGNNLEWECSFINKKVEGWKKNYTNYYDSDTTFLEEKCLFRDNELIQSVNFYTSHNSNFHPNFPADSSIIIYKNSIAYQTTYYKNGKIVKVEKGN